MSGFSPTPLNPAPIAPVGCEHNKAQADAQKRAEALNARRPAGVAADATFIPSQTFRADDKGRVLVTKRSVINRDRQEKKALKKAGYSGRQLKRLARKNRRDEAQSDP